MRRLAVHSNGGEGGASVTLVATTNYRLQLYLQPYLEHRLVPLWLTFCNLNRNRCVTGQASPPKEPTSLVAPLQRLPRRRQHTKM